MPTEDVAYQQRLKIRRTTLGFGLIQVILGLALTALSFTAFVLSESEKLRNACPYWAGFTVFCSGGVGIVAWRHSTILSMGLFTFFSAVCVVLHMIGTILTGEVGGLLKTIIICHQSVINQSCMCCDSIMTCKQNIPTFKFEGVEECSIITGLIKELMYGLCVLNIFGSLVCFIATILGCTSVARQASRDQPLFRRRLSARSDSHDQSQYSWLHYPADLNMLPPYAPPIYRSVDNFQDCGATPYVVPPPVFDPTDLPPPYCSRNASLSSSGFSLHLHSDHHDERRRNQYDRDGRGGEGTSSIVVSNHYENQFQQRIYSENRRPGNHIRITSAILTRNGVLEFSGMQNSNHGDRTADQSLDSSRASLQSEARRPIDIIGRRIEGIAQHVLHVCEKAEECKERRDSLEKLETIQGQKRRPKYISKENTSGYRRRLSNLEQSTEIIRFEENQQKRNSFEGDSIITNRIKSEEKMIRDEDLFEGLDSFTMIEAEPSSTPDSGLGDELPLCQSLNINSESDNYGKENNNYNEPTEYLSMRNDTGQRDEGLLSKRCMFDSNSFTSDRSKCLDGQFRENDCDRLVHGLDALTVLSEVQSPLSFEHCCVDGSKEISGTLHELCDSQVNRNLEGICSLNVFRKLRGLDSTVFVGDRVGGSDECLLQKGSLTEMTSGTPRENDCTLNDSKYVYLEHRQLIPNDRSHQEQLIPNDRSHQEQLIPNDRSHQEQLIRSDSSQRCHQLIPSPSITLDNEGLTDPCASDQEANITGLLLSIDDRSDLNDSCLGFPALVSELSGRNNTGMPCLDSDNILDTVLHPDRDQCCSDIGLMLEESIDENRTGKQCALVGRQEPGKDESDNKNPDCIELAFDGCYSEIACCDREKYVGIIENEAIPDVTDSIKSDDTEAEVIRMMDDFKCSEDIKRSHTTDTWTNIGNNIGLPVAEMDVKVEDWERLKAYLEQETGNTTKEDFVDPDKQEYSVPSGRSSVDYCDEHRNQVVNDSLMTNVAESLSDGGSSVETVDQIAFDRKALAQSDTCIAMETKHHFPQEKNRTCSDPGVTGVGILARDLRSYRKKSSRLNRGRRCYDDGITIAPPNIELPMEIRHLGLSSHNTDSERRKKHSGDEAMGPKRAFGGKDESGRKYVAAPRCRHSNKESTRKSKDEMLKREKALKKTIKMKNEISRSFLQLYKEKRFGPSVKDPERSWISTSEDFRNPSKKSRKVMLGHPQTSAVVSGFDVLAKGGHRKQHTKEVTGSGDRSGKETFV